MRDLERPSANGGGDPAGSVPGWPHVAAGPIDTLTPVSSEMPIRRTSPRGEAQQQRILSEAAIVFSELGYNATRLEDVAARVGLSRSGILRHYGSKERLFLETYKRAIEELPGWFDAPDEVLEQGFFATLRYWLLRSAAEPPNSVAYDIYYLGRFCSDRSLHSAITSFMRSEDPERTLEFVEFGVEQGEVDPSLDVYLVAAYIDWMVDGFEGSGYSEDFDRGGVFRHGADRASNAQRQTDAVIGLIRRAIGTDVARGR